MSADAEVLAMPLSVSAPLVRIEEYQVTPLKNGIYHRPVGKRKTEKGAINLATRYSPLNPEFVFWIWHRNEGRIGWNSHGIRVQNGERLP